MTKGPQAFRTISEAADEIGVPQHVLRFWETKFSFIRPMKRAGGRRFYRPQDLAVLRGVKALLHRDGYTIKGVQRLHKEQGIKRLVAAGIEGGGEDLLTFETDEAVAAAAGFETEGGRPALDEAARERLEDALAGLLAAKHRLRRLLDHG